MRQTERPTKRFSQLACRTEMESITLQALGERQEEEEDLSGWQQRLDWTLGHMAGVWTVSLHCCIISSQRETSFSC